MKYDQIPNDLFKRNRTRFMDHMEPGTLAVFNSNDIYPTSADGTMPFRQHRDIFYLSGADQEETILVLFPGAAKESHREILFVRKTDEHIAVWEGEKLTKEKATEVSGIETVYWLEDFERIFKGLIMESGGVYLNANEHLRAAAVVETREDRFAKWCRETYPLHTYHRSAPIMHRIRAIKQDTEIELMKHACSITEKGFRRLLEFVKPGVTEYEIEAELAHEFLRNRSRGFAYDPIVASGPNACVLHYIQNNARCEDGHVLLLDIGAEYACYASDLSRSIPVNGRYTDRQKQVYNAVLRVKNEAQKLLRPGVFLEDYHKEVGKLMESELLQLELLDKHDIAKQDPKWPAYKKYFMHGTSHFIGLDVHDVGLWHEPIQAGMAFTCEPGIYIQEEGLGIRIEDDIVVTDNGIVNLMETIPIEAEEIEDLMNG